MKRAIPLWILYSSKKASLKKSILQYWLVIRKWIYSRLKVHLIIVHIIIYFFFLFGFSYFFTLYFQNHSCFIHNSRSAPHQLHPDYRPYRAVLNTRLDKVSSCYQWYQIIHTKNKGHKTLMLNKWIGPITVPIKSLHHW